jgi:phospholipase/carboxylesterase
MEKLEKIEKASGANPQNLIVWLHGLGADATDFLILTELLRLPSTLFVFPNAPVRAVTINQGASMRAWYDIDKEDIFSGGSSEDLLQSVLQVEDLIADYTKNQNFQNIILGGFSQGGVVSMEAAYRNKQNLSKVAGFSCYFNTNTRQTAPLKKPKILLSHGALDEIIPITYGKQAKDFFISKGFAVDWRAYDIAHTVSNEQIAVLNQFLLQ